MSNLMKDAKMVLEGIREAASIVATLRRFDFNDGLAWFGLGRRRGPLFPIAAFGTGVLVGTGIGCLIAPVSGAEARRALRERFDDYMQRGAAALRRGEQEIERIEHEAEHAAAEAVSKVKSEVKKAAAKGGHHGHNGKPNPDVYPS